MPTDPTTPAPDADIREAADIVFGVAGERRKHQAEYDRLWALGGRLLHLSYLPGALQSAHRSLATVLSDLLAGNHVYALSEAQSGVIDAEKAARAHPPAEQRDAAPFSATYGVLADDPDARLVLEPAAPKPADGDMEAVARALARADDLEGNGDEDRWMLYQGEAGIAMLTLRAHGWASQAVVAALREQVAKLVATSDKLLDDLAEAQVERDAAIRRAEEWEERADGYGAMCAEQEKRAEAAEAELAKRAEDRHVAGVVVTQTVEACLARAKAAEGREARLRDALREIGQSMGMAIHDSQNLLRAVTIARAALADQGGDGGGESKETT